MPGQDQVTVKDPDFARATWVSLDLFLVQLDLQIIKEIMEYFTDGKLTLSDIVLARRKTYDVDGACKYLSETVPKRQKLEAPQESDAASQRQIKEKPSGGIKSTRDVRRVVAYPIESAGSYSKGSTLPNTTQAIAMNTDDSSTSSVGKRRDPSADAPTHYKDDMIPARVLSSMKHAPFGGLSDRILYGVSPVESHLCLARPDCIDEHHSAIEKNRLPYLHDATKGIVNAAVGGFYSLPFQGTVTPSRHSHQHDTWGYSHVTGGDLHGVNVRSQSDVVRPATRVTSNAHTVHSEITAREERQVHGFSGSDKYTNLREIGSAGGQLSRQKYPTAVVGQRGVSSSEPAEVEQTEFNSSHSKGMSERSYASPQTQSGVSDLHNTMRYNLTLANGTSEKAYKQSSSTIEATSSRAGTTRVEYVSGREVTGASRPNRSLLQGEDGAVDYNTSIRTADGRGYSLHKREQNGLSDELSKKEKETQSGEVQDAKEVRENKHFSPGSVRARFSQDQGKSDQSLQKETLEKNHHSERAKSVHVYGAAGSTLKKDHHSEGANSGLSYGAAAPCSHCTKQGDFMCKNCLVIICKECKRFYEAYHCESNKGEHVFSELKDPTLSSQQLASPGDEEKEWSCSRCTYRNLPEHKICVICATTRGVADVEESKPGSTVCKNCTLHNEEGAKVCVACDKTLDYHETFV